MHAEQAARLLRQHHGIAGTPLRRVASSQHLIFRLSLPDGSGDAALRLYPAGAPPDPIEDEVAWLAALVAQDAVDAPMPLPALDGRLLQTVVDDEGQSREAVLLRWVRGRHLDRGLAPVHLRRLGHAVAALHDTSSRLGPPRAGSRQVGSALAEDWTPAHAAWHDLLPPDGLTLLREAALRLQAQVHALGAAGSGLLHTDLHAWNCLHRGQRVGIVDFSDCAHGPWVHDMASALCWIRHPWVGNTDHGPLIAALEAAFLEGYAERRPLPGNLGRALRTCMAARMLDVVHWAVTEWPHPTAVRDWGPGLALRLIAGLREGYFFS